MAAFEQLERTRPDDWVYWSALANWASTAGELEMAKDAFKKLDGWFFKDIWGTRKYFELIRGEVEAGRDPLKYLIK